MLLFPVLPAEAYPDTCRTKLEYTRKNVNPARTSIPQKGGNDDVIPLVFCVKSTGGTCLPDEPCFLLDDVVQVVLALSTVVFHCDKIPTFNSFAG